MSASSTSDARRAFSAERFKMLRELGSDVAPTWAALESLPGGGSRLVVVERVLRGSADGQGLIARWAGSARGLTALDHPNVGRVRDVLLREGDALIVSDFVDGVRWSELSRASPRPTLELALRVLVDVLSGLSALHNLRDVRRQPLKLAHGEVTAAHVIVGLDGIARVTGGVRLHASLAADEANPARRYLAPEVRSGGAADARSDVYSAGVLLWEALSGADFPLPGDPRAEPPRASAPEGTPWAQPLVRSAQRALAVQPEQRFTTAAAFATEVRQAVGAKLAPAARTAGLVRAAYGERIRTRRAALESDEIEPAPETLPRLPAPAPDPVRAPREEPKQAPRPAAAAPPQPPVIVDFDDRASTLPPPPPPRPAAAPLPEVDIAVESEPPLTLESIPVVAAPGPPPLPRQAAAVSPPPPRIVPPAPPVPRDLAASIAGASAATGLRSQSPRGASDVTFRIERSSATRLRWFAAALLLAFALVGWLVSRSFSSAGAPAPSGASRGASHPSVPVATAAPAHPSSAASAAAAATQSPPAPTESPSEPAAAALAPADSSAAAPAPAPLSPSPPKTAPKAKYDPEGI